MSQYYDDEQENNSGAFKVAGGVAGGFAGNAAHKHFKKDEIEAAKNADGHLDRKAKRALKDYRSVEAAIENGVDLSEAGFSEGKLTNHSLVKAQVESGKTLTISESAKKFGGNVKNAPGDLVDGAKGKVSNARNKHVEKAVKRKTGVELDLGRHTADNSAKAARANMHHGRSAVKVQGYKKPKVSRVKGGLTSIVAGVVGGVVIGNAVEKMTRGPERAPMQFDPYAAQGMAGMPVVPPYGMPMDGHVAALMAAQGGAPEMGR